MQADRSTARAALFLAFGISGFSGLMYESVWTHYIKLFLGHAAYAQTLVLAIFMGGLALGSWLASRHGGRWSNLLVMYAWVEGIVGLIAIGFHPIFVAATDLSYERVIPALGSGAAVHAWKWGLSAALILPQSILLGMTFPLMSGGIIRRWPSTPGGWLAMLYFSNSIGAALGVLVAGFYLIGKLGLPGTMLTAGLINLSLALVVWLWANDKPVAAPATKTAEQSGWWSRRWVHGMLLVAATTGAASFVYEIAWIRLLSLVLGSSTQAFELMLSAFILGLALGGLWIRRRIDAVRDPVATLGRIQIAMGALALLTLPLYGSSFDLMQVFLRGLSHTDTGYSVFHVASHLICLLVMLPATFCAGMTLPLITCTLLRRGGGERAIGAVYAANTLGSILGVLIAVHLLMPLTNASRAVAAGSAMDIVLGMALLWFVLGAAGRMRLAGVALAAMAIAASTLSLSGLEPRRLASGVYRTGDATLPEGAQILFHRDGKTATVSLFRMPDGLVTISTNGKPDASIGMGEARAVSDETTMVLAGALGLAYQPNAKTAANIGLGSGLTANAMLSTPQLERLDTIEIEAQMAQAARGFGARVNRTFDDPRSRIHLEDAKAFFSAQRRVYDIIVSEPSNPWVSGVASLFSEEFYNRVRTYMAPDGVFIQWLQLYETDTQIVASILKALGPRFSDYVIYSPNVDDMLIVARKEGQLPPLRADLFRAPGMRAELARVGIHHLGDLEARRIGHKAMLDPAFQSFGAPPNSDYFPFVDQQAARARFVEARAYEVSLLPGGALPLVEMLGLPVRWDAYPPLTADPYTVRAQFVTTARELKRLIMEKRYGDLPEHATPALLVPHLFVDACDNANSKGRWIDSLIELAGVLTPYLSAEELEPIWTRLEARKCSGRLARDQRQWLALVRAVGRRDAQAMAELSRGVLADGLAEGHPNRVGYAVKVGMLGHLAHGRPGQTFDIWAKYGARQFPMSGPPLDVRVMLALAGPDAYQAWQPSVRVAKGDGALGAR